MSLSIGVVQGNISASMVRRHDAHPELNDVLQRVCYSEGKHGVVGVWLHRYLDLQGRDKRDEKKTLVREARVLTLRC